MIFGGDAVRLLPRVLGGGDGTSSGGVRPAGHVDRGAAVPADRPYREGSGEAAAGDRGADVGAGAKRARYCARAGLLAGVSPHVDPRVQPDRVSGFGPKMERDRPRTIRVGGRFACSPGAAAPVTSGAAVGPALEDRLTGDGRDALALILAHRRWWPSTKKARWSGWRSSS